MFGGWICLELDPVSYQQVTKPIPHTTSQYPPPYTNIGTEASIFVFRYDDELMFSFMGYGKHCILSDWYPIIDDTGELLEKLDIANMPISSSTDYFVGFVDTLARS